LGAGVASSEYSQRHTNIFEKDNKENSSQFSLPVFTSQSPVGKRVTGTFLSPNLITKINGDNSGSISCRSESLSDQYSMKKKEQPQKKPEDELMASKRISTTSLMNIVAT
jgi:hypothetical protein